MHRWPGVTGAPTWEFLYAEDAAEGILLATERYNESDPVNQGSGMEISIKDLVHLIARLTGFEGEIVWDTSPSAEFIPSEADGLRTGKAEWWFGFRVKTLFEEGLRQTLAWYLQAHQQEPQIAQLEPLCIMEGS